MPVYTNTWLLNLDFVLWFYDYVMVVTYLGMNGSLMRLRINDFDNYSCRFTLLRTPGTFCCA